MRVSALIPARTGSRRLPGKNIRHLGGIPLIDWTIKSALKSEVFDGVYLSTDSPEIRHHGIDGGCDPFPLRPAALADDNASTLSVVLHCLEVLQLQDVPLPEMLMLLQPTSPFRSAFRIKEALDAANSDSCREVVSVGPVWKPASWNCSVKDKILRRSSSEAEWTINGSIYLLSVKRLLAGGEIFPPDPRALKMENWESIDIDNQLDWILAEGLAETVIHRHTSIGRLAEMMVEAKA
jgi:CMP-N,N'-diacetyllegionaminic acid synthase